MKLFLLLAVGILISSAGYSTTFEVNGKKVDAQLQLNPDPRIGMLLFFRESARGKGFAPI